MELISSKELKSFALEKLTGHWFVAMAVTFVAALFESGGSISSGGSGAAESGSNISSGSYDSGVVEIIEVIPNGVLAALSAFLAVAVILAIVAFVIGGAIKLGHCLFYIKLCRDEPVSFKTLFSRFNKLVKAFGLNFMMGIFVLLWTLLFIIPGIVAYYRYAMAPYIMAENPTIGVFEAIDASKKMMKGYKSDLFMLHLSFIGWGILCLLTLGLGFIVLGPYMQASEAAFYLQRTGQIESEPEALLQ